MSPTVDVAVIAHGRWDLTASCLTHLARQTLEHHVILLDNGCREGTSARAAAAFPEADVLRSERNLAFAAACNLAVAAGAGEFVVILNNDVDAAPEFLARLIAPLIDDHAVGSVASLLLRPGDGRIDSAGLVADRTLAGYARFAGGPAAAASAAGPALTGAAGAAAAYRRTAWTQAGGLDEALPGYHEDLDLALRLRTAGWQAALALDARAVHVGSATFGLGTNEQRRRSGFGRAYVLRRYGVLRTRAAAPALAAETAVVCADAVLSRDLAALRGRLSGWRAAGGRPRHPSPPPGAVDQSIGFVQSLRLRSAAIRRQHDLQRVRER